MLPTHVQTPWPLTGGTTRPSRDHAARSPRVSVPRGSAGAACRSSCELDGGGPAGCGHSSLRAQCLGDCPGGRQRRTRWPDLRTRRCPGRPAVCSGRSRIKPAMIGTACWRGYLCWYRVDSGSPRLVKGVIGSGSKVGGRTVSAVTTLLGSTVVPGPSWTGPGWEAGGLDLPVPFTGELLLGQGFIRSTHVRIGFRSARNFQTIVELLPEHGKVASSRDRFAELTALRRRIENGEAPDPDGPRVASNGLRGLSTSITAAASPDTEMRRDKHGPKIWSLPPSLGQKRSHSPAAVRVSCAWTVTVAAVDGVRPPPWPRAGPGRVRRRAGRAVSCPLGPRGGRSGVARRCRNPRRRS